MGTKQYSVRKHGETIIVSVIDELNRTLFKGSAKINDEKGMARLINDLDAKGINLKKEIKWLD